MSDNIPLEIEEEIIKRLPVKSLIQFRSVSKTWKSLIGSTDFIIKHYNGHHAQVHHLLVKYDYPDYDYKKKYVSLIDDDTLHQQTLVSLTLPTLVKRLQGYGNRSFQPPEVEIFTLSTEVWRRSYGNLPCKSIHFVLHNEVIVGGVFYWPAADRGPDDGVFHYNMMISFDMTSEEFREITFPDSLTNIVWSLTMYKLGESLVMGKEDDFENSGLDVWLMGGGDLKSFTKLFTITPEIDAIVVGFRRSGEPVIEISNRYGPYGCEQLAVYKPNSKRIDNLDVWFFQRIPTWKHYFCLISKILRFITVF
ncbi:putative F-box protein At1g32420 [Bidens hawaiensis]|uniref:putative F-box protein At1g32420 n=1 Tax=Bidens hawaiensis TaxID=980011 RepID=UPI0040497849